MPISRTVGSVFHTSRNVRTGFQSSGEFGKRVMTLINQTISDTADWGLFTTTSCRAINLQHPEQRKFLIRQTRRMKIELEKELLPLLKLVQYKAEYIYSNTGFM